MVTDDYRGYQKGVYVWLPEEPVRAMAAVSQAGAPFLPPIYRRDAEDAEKNLNRQKPRATTGQPDKGFTPIHRCLIFCLVCLVPEVLCFFPFAVLCAQRCRTPARKLTLSSRIWRTSA